MTETADTAPIRAEEAFDEAMVAAYLRSHVPDLVGDDDITFDQFHGGKANLTYRAVAGANELVLRRAPLGEVARGGHDMEREFTVLSRLWRAYPLAPRAFHFCADAGVMGKPFFVMERRRGFVVRNRWPEPWPEGDLAIRRRAAQSLVEALARLHVVEPASVDLDAFGNPDGFVARQVDGWARRWSAARTRDVPDMEVVAGLLGSRVPRPQRATLLHNDFKLDNTMLSADVMLAYWTDKDGPTYPVFGADGVVLTPYMTRDEVVSAYAAATGFDVSGVRFYEGLALYRIAVIVEQIYARYLRGQTSDPRFGEFEPLAPILASAAREVLEGGAL
jgi:aminoglycoside phosphotransferase (APT) family kinase protein